MEMLRMIYNKHSISFDLETEGLDKNTVLERTKPYPSFDPGSIKLGDCRTDEARAEKLARAETEHRKKEEEYYQTAVEKAALNAETGRILTIAYLPIESSEPVVDFHDDEAELLKRFWAGYREVKRNGGLLIGHNVAGFDVPYLLRRSWINRVPVPGNVFNGRYLSPIFCDTMQAWACGEFRRFIALDLLASLLNVGGKSQQEVTGAEFASYWRAGGEKRELAQRYAELDVLLVRDVYKVLCGIA